MIPNGPPEVSKQLELLMTYTLFHLGLYSVMFGAVVAYYEKKEHNCYATFGLVGIGGMFAWAGVNGATIASTIPHYTRWDTFVSDSFGPWLWTDVLKFDTHSFEWWSRWEHMAFWIAVFASGVFIWCTSIWLPSVCKKQD